MSQASATASSAPNKIHFWFEFASTYSYLSAARIAKVGKAANVEIVWEPFLLGPIFKQQGWADSPFNLYEQKGRYMWRDMERLCDGYGLPFRRPDKFPMNSLLATRVAMLGRGEEWLPGFARALYHANFADGQDIADPATLDRILAALPALCRPHCARGLGRKQAAATRTDGARRTTQARWRADVQRRSRTLLGQ